MARVVVTGGAGKLGRACVDELIRHGWDVVVFDRVRPPSETGAVFVPIDLTDYGQVRTPCWGWRNGTRGGRLPWSVLRGIYTRIGASEGIDPGRLADVDLGAVASSFADRYPKRRYPEILVGSSNGALTHLAAAMQVPWLPDTVLVPVAHEGDTNRPDQAMDFGRSVGPALLDRNPDVVLHHMHDQLQDVLMAERMSYFRVKCAGCLRHTPSSSGPPGSGRHCRGGQ